MTTRDRIYALFPIDTPVIGFVDGIGPFTARVLAHKDGGPFHAPLFTVIDQDGDAFDCEAHELEHLEEA